MSRLLLLAALALILLPACGGEEGSGDDTAASGGGDVVDVALTDFAIEPSAITLDPGSYTFRVTNDGAALHALEIEGPSGEVETSDLAAGESAELNVDLEDGEYEMYCPVGDHRDRGMKGTITVGAGGGGTTTDETTTDDDEDSGYRY
jgi:plastocyanin